MSLQQSHFSFIFSQHAILGAGAGAVCALATAGRAIDIAIAIIILFIGISVKIVWNRSSRTPRRWRREFTEEPKLEVLVRHRWINLHKGVSLHRGDWGNGDSGAHGNAATLASIATILPAARTFIAMPSLHHLSMMVGRRHRHCRARLHRQRSEQHRSGNEN
ncbi:MAG: hypothetical protein ABIP07_05560 [Sphingomicrobium sp.]